MLTIRVRRLAAALAVAAATALPALAQTPAKGGSLTYTYHPEPTAMSTIATTAVPLALVATKIYESLLQWEGAGMTPVPGLAESWTRAEDGKTWTFKLRPGVTWHDGQPFTSEDVKFSIESIIRPYHSRGRALFGDVESIETPDATTVVFRMKAPVPYFLKAFQPTEAPMMPRHRFAGVDLAQAAAVRQAEVLTKSPVGTGPFRLKEWQRGSHIILERNPTYWREGRPYLDQVILRVLPDGAARAIAMEKGEVDLAPQSALPEAEIQRLSKLPALEASMAGAEALGPNMWLELNLREAPLNDLRVRQAMSMALDRQRIIDVIWYGYGKPGIGPIVSADPTYFNKALKPYVYDPRRANALLDEAGYKRGADGVRFRMTQHVLPYGEAWTRLGEYVKQEFGKLGIAVDTKSADLAGWLKAVYGDWAFQMTSTFQHNYADPTIGVERSYLSANIKPGAAFMNSMAYKNPRVDELFALAARELDPAKRKVQFDEVQQIIHDEMPVLYLMEMQYVHLWNRRVNGLITNGISMYSGWDGVWKSR
ncbi:MAG: ABC transporter substrate-binding protein [Alphaproteobacteria bacterium]|nr:ABC transporter substrate-binding protein [Alphaproteobacteria bacterium]